MTRSPDGWDPEDETDFMFASWEMAREGRSLEREMVSFAPSSMAPSGGHTPTGEELERLRGLVRSALATSPLPSAPRIPLEARYGGFSVRDPFLDREPRTPADEPTFPKEVSTPTEELLVAHGYVRHTRRDGDGRASTWHTDPGGTLETFLVELAREHLPLELSMRESQISGRAAPESRTTVRARLRSLLRPHQR